MFGRSSRGSTVSLILLASALVLTALLPNIVVGDSPPAAPAAPAEAVASPVPAGSPASWLTTTSADFGAGTLDAGTYISETADGEVILAPTFGAEFSGSSLPAGMSSTPWFPPNGTATVAGGKLTLDGVRVGTDAMFGAGRSLEFSANMTTASLDTMGFANQPGVPASAIYGTGLFGLSLMATTNNGTVQSSPLASSFFDVFNRYRIDWSSSGVAYFVNGVSVGSHTNSPTMTMRPQFGNLWFGGKVLVVDWVRLSPYAASGIFMSGVFDAGSHAHWVDLNAATQTPDGTAIIIETRSGDTAVPDATWSPWQGLSGTSIQSPDSRYLQYRAILSTTVPASTPVLASVNVNLLAPCSEEICNGLDDDCDGLVDEGDTLCDDNNSCTADACVAGHCDNKPTPDVACDDRNACTKDDTCNADGRCVGVGTICDDQNPCTKDSCDPATGLCVFTPAQNEPCDDGNACTKGDTCNADGRCVGVETTCNDQNACTKDSCNPATGLCVFEPTPNERCDDGNACTRDDTCSANGQCVGDTFLCDDKNPCTKDACDPATGQCVFTPAQGEPCDDGNACTKDDKCNADGFCAGAETACDDLDPCTSDSCDPKTGECIFVPNPGAACSDGNACTSHDTCDAAGKCVGEPIICNDGNECTADACLEGQCVSSPLPAGSNCSDGDACTRGDACDGGGKCVGQPIVCDDQNQCTADKCVGGECVFEPTPDATCDDGDACTQDDRCVRTELGGIECKGKPTDCDDHNFCTTDRCEPAGCVVPDDGTGTAILLPGTCDYTSRNDLAIIDGLPAGSTIGIGATQKNTCPAASTFCSFALPIPGVDCEASGGSLGGEQQCAAGTLTLSMTGTGALAGFTRTIDIAVNLEANSAPRTPGDPVQSFNTQALRLLGQVTLDPDFDLLRITGGGDFGLPSPGHTTLTQVAGGNWAVDSFFDITYRIDFIGSASGQLAGMSGSTTGTARFSTGGGTCVHTPIDCDDKNPCTKDSCDPASGQCAHTPTPGETCDDGNACTTDDTCNADGVCAGVGKVCDDQNPCTKDSCDPATQTCIFEPTPGETCNDGNACTQGDACDAAGHCVGEAVLCTDRNTCTKDSCDPATGQCVFEPTPGEACEDRNLCTTDDKCNADGVCVGVETPCDDHNSCTKDSCDRLTGQCVYEPTPGEICDDGNACTAGDACNPEGHCIGDAVRCLDKNSCTKDSCDPATGQCVFEPTPGEPCDDGNACTNGDTCNADAACVGVGTPCDDQNACTKDSCDPATGHCVFEPTPGETCDDGNACTRDDKCSPNGQCLGTGTVCNDDNPCTKDSCDPASGQCKFEPTPNEHCDDGNACTHGDTCNADGHCTGVGPDCNDQNPCTKDSCDPATGQCVHEPTPGETCDDGNACTRGDTCGPNGQCAGEPIVCNDNNSCTKDSCDPASGACRFEPTPGETCDDGNACTTDDKCNADGHCVGTGTACDDQNSCTRDFCDPTTGQCVHQPTPSNPCDDGNACTLEDICGPTGQCVGTVEKFCNDDNTCTRDSCDPATGQCKFEPMTDERCDDGNACTLDDKCSPNGQCAGTPKVCDDHNSCTSDSCDALFGECRFEPTPNATCDDGDGCTHDDKCNENGRCVGVPSICDDHNQCTSDSCSNGLCIFVSTYGVACDDGNTCTTGDVCSQTPGGGIGCVGTPVTCDDQNGCTTDHCDSATGQCEHRPVDCDDLNACTVDHCNPASGQCEHRAVDCDDGNQCTRDSCDPASGECKHDITPEANCDDGNACTRNDHCTPNGQCAGQAINCDDGNQCTLDTCDPATGACHHGPIPQGACDDGSACTRNDRCNADGQCVGETVSCDDGNSCTDDTCTAAAGCVHTNNTAPCSDGNACTSGDTCNGGQCRGGQAVNCDDGNVCTVDRCDPSDGVCAHVPGNAGVTCRPAAGACDIAEVCDGASPTCPGDAKSTAVCRPSAGQCDVQESCDGTSNDCPVDGLRSSATVCRPSAGQCDVAERCSGSSTACPPDGFAPAATSCTGTSNGGACDGADHCTGTGNSCLDVFQPNTYVCRPSAGQCDVAETCTGTSGACPANGLAPNGTSCSDGNACTTGDICNGGQCRGGQPPNCDDGNACTADACDPAAGCTHQPLGVLQAVCSMNPSTLNRTSQGTGFSVNLSIVNACNPGNPSPIPPGSIGIVHVSRAGGTVFPDPAAVSCPAAGGGTSFETGLFEDLAARTISGNTAGLKFDRPSDANCSTIDGGRPDLLRALSGVPDGTSAPVCVSAMAGGQTFECCTTVRVTH